MKVFHRIKPDFLGMNKPVWPNNDYTLVAEVDTNDVESAFMWTQHVDFPWQENVGVDATPGSHRSTSVGDVVVDNDGIAHWCQSFGWETL